MHRLLCITLAVLLSAPVISQRPANDLSPAKNKSGSFIKTNVGVDIYPDESFTRGAQVVHLEVVAPGIIRVHVVPAGGIPKPSLVTVYKSGNVPFKIDSSAGSVSLQTSSIKATVNLQTGNIVFFDSLGKRILGERFIDGRGFTPQVFEGQPSFSMFQSFQTTPDDSWYGLGQHQDDQFNYRGQQVNLFQNNTEVAVPFLVSSKHYGILWDNYSLTKIGDTRPFLPLSSLRLFSASGDEGFLTTSYYNDKKDSTRVTVQRPEAVIDMEFVNESKLKLPAEFTPATGMVKWEGSLSSVTAGLHKLHFVYGGYIRVWIDGNLILDRWREAWNPAPASIDLQLESGKKRSIKIEWLPEGGESYLAVKYQQPVDNAMKDVYSFASEAGQGIDYYFISGHNMDEVISGYRKLSGKATIVPKWALGFWQSRERYKTQDEILSTVAEFRKRRIPLDNIVLDWFYWKENQWGSQEFDPERFPSPDSMIAKLHRDYHTQLMISVWPKFYEYVPAYDDFNKKGWLYKRNIADRQKDWVGPGYTSTFYDAFNDEARKGFWKLIHDRIYTKGIDAWWMDASEPDILSNVSPERRKQQMTPVSAGLVAEYVNAYPLQNAKGIYEGQRSADNNKRVFLLTRSGFAGSQRYAAAIWSGDIGARWHDMKAQISAGLNFSMSGLPYWTMDIGGFVVERRFEEPNAKDLEEWRELNMRWYQFGAFAPLFRAHGQSPKREIFNIAPDTHPAYQSMLYYNKLRYRLMPYIYSIAGQSYHNDYTIMRGLVMDFAADTNTHSIGDQFMFGPSLLVSPVYTAGALKRRLYLPPGGWYNFYDGRYEEGSRYITADAPYARMPLYVRGGAILPTGPALQYVAEKKMDTILLQVFQGADGSFTLYEDEGLNYNYEKGQFANIRFTYDDKAQSLRISAREGGFPGMLLNRIFIIRYIRKDKKVAPDPEVMKGVTVRYNGSQQEVRLK